jgi:hypothetical protein
VLHPGVEHDPANWDRASYSAHPVDETEPQESAPNDYRQSAIARLQLLSTIDSFVYEAKDPRVAWLGIGLVLNLNSVRGLTTDEVVRQIRVKESTLIASADNFRKAAGNGVYLIQPRSNGARH